MRTSAEGFPSQTSLSLNSLISSESTIFAVNCFISAQIYATRVACLLRLLIVDVINALVFEEKRLHDMSEPHISVVSFLNSSRSILYPIPCNQSRIWHSGWNFGGIQLWIQMESRWNPVKDFQMGSWWNPGRIPMEFPSNPGEDFSIVGLVLLPPPPLSSLPGGCFSRSGLTWNAPQFSHNHWPTHPPTIKV